MLRIGSGAGFSGDRWDAAIPVVRTLLAHDGPRALIFETLAERTLALAQLQRKQHPGAGWEPSLERFVAPVLTDCVRGGIPIIGNFGAAHPHGAAKRLQELAASLGLPSLRIAVVMGDDLLTTLDPDRMEILLAQSAIDRPLVSANAYLGAREIAGALRAGAQIVVTGRVADPALALGPMLAHFEWREDDWNRLAAGTMAGHILECGAQVCGGYFADPGVKDVPDLAHVGFPIIEMHENGRFIVTKAEATGGCVDRRTVIEQLLYEIHDPGAYLTPDVVADITEADVREVGQDRVEITGIRGHPRPATVKATLCYEGPWLAEGEISYAGPNAAARSALAAEIVRERLKTQGLGHLKIRADFIGISSVFADDQGRWTGAIDVPASTSQDLRLRIAAAAASRTEAEQVTREVLALYTCGPAGGGGVRTAITPRLASGSCLVPREWLSPAWEFAA